MTVLYAILSLVGLVIVVLGLAKAREKGINLGDCPCCTEGYCSKHKRLKTDSQKA